MCVFVLYLTCSFHTSGEKEGKFHSDIKTEFTKYTY